MRVLDIGCGPGNILKLMPDTEYVGFDLNPHYIEQRPRSATAMSPVVSLRRRDPDRAR